mmetsp:Transcript_40906/g.118202  ORF Transcript_40906/g.118202 Transcript_40906/m.118202 type:complete len:215 (+) Transcript_40906:269-913(+)
MHVGSPQDSGHVGLREPSLQERGALVAQRDDLIAVGEGEEAYEAVIVLLRLGGHVEPVERAEEVLELPGEDAGHLDRAVRGLPHGARQHAPEDWALRLQEEGVHADRGGRIVFQLELHVCGDVGRLAGCSDVLDHQGSDVRGEHVRSLPVHEVRRALKGRNGSPVHLPDHTHHRERDSLLQRDVDVVVVGGRPVDSQLDGAALRLAQLYRRHGC